MSSDIKIPKISQKHLLGIKYLSVEDINKVLELGNFFKLKNKEKNKNYPILTGRTVINLFFEPSTRTLISFEIAAKRLGADVVNMNIQGSSLRKGVTLFDTAQYFEPSDLNKYKVETFNDLNKGIKDSDIVMMLRIQNERILDTELPSTKDYFLKYGLTSERLKNAKEDVLVMHPGPINRDVEIESSLADDVNKSVINEQVENGVAIRMACLAILLK